MPTITGLEAFRSRIREQVGVVLTDEKRVWVAKLPNRSRDPDASHVWYEDLYPRLRPGLRVLAFLHTHFMPGDTKPSDYDYMQMPAPWSTRRFDVPGIVYHVRHGTIVWYDRAGIIEEATVGKRGRKSSSRDRRGREGSEASRDRDAG